MNGWSRNSNNNWINDYLFITYINHMSGWWLSLWAIVSKISNPASTSAVAYANSSVATIIGTKLQLSTEFGNIWTCNCTILLSQFHRYNLSTCCTSHCCSINIYNHLPIHTLRAIATTSGCCISILSQSSDKTLWIDSNRSSCQFC